MTVKTTYTFTLLHDDSLELDSLEHALYESTQGEAVGNVTACTTEAVPDTSVRDELIALGNDGTFFESFDL
jgi:hypothetical protein